MHQRQQIVALPPGKVDLKFPWCQPETSRACVNRAQQPSSRLLMLHACAAMTDFAALFNDLTQLLTSRLHTPHKK